MLGIRPFAWIALAGALLQSASFAQSSCKRVNLQWVADRYIEEQTKGARVVRAEALEARMASQTLIPVSDSPFPLVLIPRVGYVENFDDAVAFNSRLIDQPLAMDHHRTLLDTIACETFTEAIVTDKSEPYALGTRHSVGRGGVTEIAVVWSTTGHSGFDPDLYLKATSTENWGAIPVGDRDSRATLQTVANLYLDALLEGKAEVEPWGAPCKNRAADGSCQVGLPVAAVNIANRHAVIDETIGAVAIISTFGAPPSSGRIRTPDVHVFRIENGRVRFVHAITHLPPRQ